ncbi:DsbA family protein [Candidatus Falkowbacteria bacterium]|nr:DsbA family protein [Candidatus Falkowbacteria bacterium]
MPKQKIDLLKKTRPWYVEWWGKIILAFLALFLVFLPFYFFQLYKVYKQFKSGEFISAEALEKQAPYKMAYFVDSMSPSIGAEDAKITIVEFGDFNCSRTKEEAAVLKQVAAEYKDKIKVYWRNYPVFAESSADLALASICAHKQGMFWLFHDYLFQNQGDISVEKLKSAPTELGLDKKKFESCLSNPLTQAQIKKDYYAAKDGEVAGTPTFFVNGFKLQGAIPIETWREIIDKFIRIYEKDL